MILIVTSKRDGHIGSVARHLNEAHEPWARINVEDFATNTEVTIQPTTGTGTIFVKDSGKEINLEDIRVVWYRKPDPVNVQHFDIGDPAALDYVEAEFNEIIHGIYALLDRAVWINNPLHTRLAHRKLLQLKTAAEVGFAVPETLVKNLAAPALDFVGRKAGELAIKSLGAISVIQDKSGYAMQYGIFTRRVCDRELMNHIDKINHMPTLLQEFLEKDAELRITCVGEKVFACEIRARPGDVTADDYRFDTPNLPHTPVERPELVNRMHAYMKTFGLNFGCFDFILPKDGSEPIFLEMNPNGQWLWVQQRTGQQIAEAIAAYLIKCSGIATAEDHSPSCPLSAKRKHTTGRLVSKTEIADEKSGARLAP